MQGCQDHTHIVISKLQFPNGAIARKELNFPIVKRFETNVSTVTQCVVVANLQVGNSGMFRPEMLRPMGLPEDVSVIAWGLSLVSA
eukprot:205260-Pelagomonas_calceolata.AAC.1